ncbi:LytR/AlgR family response regulator transcription factor [Sphingobacterium hungaricum]|uniref:Two-component system response regulator n=1 Tax=Sphingobacterium hungaricum TaxID=2082723 RepID=A0A928YNW8_9SPHI|nr:response regulator transcription factor [Sphingobacterium hungaricum]MBE8712304.1 two-component system response regulator [Sphingobacterium hungaricum]
MPKTIRCILLDDELPSLTYLKMLCEQIEDLEVVRSFNNALVLIKDYESLDFDFYISDIEMPGMNGLELASVLNNYPVIFTTAYKQYALEAFDKNAIDYLSKPVQINRLEQAIAKMRKYLSHEVEKPTFFQAQSNKGKAMLFFKQLNYIQNSEVDSRDKLAFLTDGSSLVLKNITFKKLLEILPDEEFVRINKKEILALRIIKFYSSDEITTKLQDESDKPLVFSLSETYRKSLLDKTNQD